MKSFSLENPMRGSGVASSSSSGRWRKFPSSKQQQRQKFRFSGISSRRILRLLPFLAVLAFAPPIFFHFRLKRLHQTGLRKCGWLDNPPLVCAHGGASTNAIPNTMDAYHSALHAHVDCIEIDVSRSSDGVLFALHDRDLQRMSSNSSAKVGYMSRREIKELDAGHQLPIKFQNQDVPTVEDALSKPLQLVSKSVRVVILDAKVGPPSYEKGLAEDILSVVRRTNCKNCIVWSKSDILAKDVIKLLQDVEVGYIVMKVPSTGARSSLLRMKGATVVGVYHPLIDETLVRILHGKNKKVYAWTVDDEASMRKMLFERVNGIITGKPTDLQGLMESMKTECIEEGYRLP